MPTTPTPTPSSVRTARTPSRSSAITSRSRIRRAGPNFFEFGDDVLYRINIDNTGDGKADVAYEFRFDTKIRNPDTFLYNTGPIASLTDPNFNRPQTYTVTEVRGTRRRQLKTRHADAAVQHRATVHARTTPTWPTRRSPRSAAASRSSPGSGWTASTSISGRVFDLAVLRPFQNLHLIPSPATRRRQCAAVVQRAHDRDPGADRRADPERQIAVRMCSTRRR